MSFITNSTSNQETKSYYWALVSISLHRLHAANIFSEPTETEQIILRGHVIHKSSIHAYKVNHSSYEKSFN